MMDDQAPEAIDPMDKAASLIANSFDESDPPEEDEEQDAETEDPGEESEDAEAEEADVTEAPKATVLVAGQPVELPEGTPPAVAARVQEIGKSLQADYTKHKQELASREKQAAEFFQAELNASRARAEQAVQQVGAIVQAFGGFLTPVQMVELKHANPEEWAMRDRMQAHLIQAQQHAQELEQQAQNAKHQRDEAAKQEAWQRLNAEGVDRKGLEKLWGDVRAVYPSLTDERLSQVLDADSWLVLRDAVAYRQLKAQTPAITKKVSEAPKLPAAKTPMPQEVRQKLDARKAVTRKGGASMRDLAAFIATNTR